MAWNFTSDRRIYLQLMEQVKLRMATGVYPAGSRLPSVRELAAEASVNPNTMQRALAQLEADGLIFAQRTSGRYVTDREETVMNLKTELAQAIVQQFLIQMKELGISPAEAAKLVAQTNIPEKEA